MRAQCNWLSFNIQITLFTSIEFFSQPELIFAGWEVAVVQEVKHVIY